MKPEAIAAGIECLQNPDRVYSQAEYRKIIAGLIEDARRYRWLREQNWNDGPLCVVCRPKETVKLGTDCPNRDRLDAAIDAASNAP